MKKNINNQIFFNTSRIINNELKNITSAVLINDDVILVDIGIPKLQKHERISQIKAALRYTGGSGGFDVKVSQLPYVFDVNNINSALNSLSQSDIIASSHVDSNSSTTMKYQYLDITNITFIEGTEMNLAKIAIQINYKDPTNKDLYIYPFSNNQMDQENNSSCIFEINNVQGLGENSNLLSFDFSDKTNVNINLFTGEVITKRTFVGGSEEAPLVAIYNPNECLFNEPFGFEFAYKYKINNVGLLEQEQTSNTVELIDYTNTTYYYKYLESQGEDSNRIHIFYCKDNHTILYKSGNKYVIQNNNEEKTFLEKNGNYYYVVDIDENITHNIKYMYDENGSITKIWRYNYEIDFQHITDDESTEYKKQLYFDKSNKTIKIETSVFEQQVTNIYNTNIIEERFASRDLLEEIHNNFNKESIVFEYDSENRVNKVMFFKNLSVEEEINYDCYKTLRIYYYNNYTQIFDDENGELYTYHFDKSGRLKEVTSRSNDRQSISYNDNIIKSINKSERLFEPLKNGSFENNLENYDAISNVEVVTGVLSNKCLKVQPGSYLRQTVELKKGKKYKIQGVANFPEVGSPDTAIVLEGTYQTHEVVDENGDYSLSLTPIYKSFEIFVLPDSFNTGWHGFESDEIVLPLDAENIYATLSIYGENNVFIDEITLSGVNSIQENLLNEEFTFENCDLEDEITTNIESEYGGNVYKLTGVDVFNNKIKVIKTIQAVDGKKDEIYNVSVMFKGYLESSDIACLYVKVTYPGETVKYKFKATPYFSSYQRVFGAFKAEFDFTNIEVGFEYSGPKTIYLEEFELAQNYTEQYQNIDDDQNIKEVGSSTENVRFEYNSKGQIEKIVSNDGSFQKITYNDYNLVKSIEDDNENKKDYTYDPYKRLLKTEQTTHLTKKENGVSVDDTKKAVTISEKTYPSGDEQLITITKTNEFDEEVIHKLDWTGRIVNTIYPNNINIQREYNYLDCLSKLTAIESSNVVGKNELSYINKLLSDVDAYNNSYYSFTYDVHNNLTGIYTSNDIPVETYEYLNTSKPKQLTKKNILFDCDLYNEIYTVAQYLKYIYNNKDQLIQVNLETSTNDITPLFKFKYDIRGNIIEIQDLKVNNS